MEVVKKVEHLLFRKMLTLQNGRMQSQLAFVLAMVFTFLFKHSLVIFLYLLPINVLKEISGWFLLEVARFNLEISLGVILLMVALFVMFFAPAHIMGGKMLLTLQAISPWMEALCLLISTVILKLLQINIENSKFLLICNAIALILITFSQLMMVFFDCTKSPRTQNYFHKREARTIAIISIIELAFCYFLAIRCNKDTVLESGELIIYSVLQFLISAGKLKQRIYLKYYLSNFSQNISNIFYFLELNLSLLILARNLLNLSFISNNLLPLLIIMTMLGYGSLVAYLSRRNGNLFLSNTADLKSQDQAILYLDCLCELVTKVENQEEDIILISLKKKHILGCKDSGCFCQSSTTLGSFIQEYVKCELNAMSELFHSSPEVLISVLFFKMVLFQFYPEVLARLNHYSTHFTLSLSHRFHSFSLSQQVVSFIRRRNFEIGAVDSQHMFKLEEIRGQIESIIRNQIEVRCKKWKYLSRGLCRVSQLENSCNQQLKSIKRIMQIYEKNKVRFRKSKEFNLLLLFYFVKVSFINSGRQIRENLKEIYYGYKEDELHSIKQFRKFIFHKRSCVIETLIDSKAMGTVTAASRNIEQMFGFPSNKLLGMSINSLMPQFMASEHQNILSTWAKSGTWRTIGKLKQIYCIHKEQYCFSALIYLKIYVKDGSLHFITNIFKLNETDYLVLNPNHKIEGLGKKFLKLLGEPAKRISLDLLIQSSNGMLSTGNYSQDKLYRKVFLGLKNMEAEVDIYLEGLNMKFTESERMEANEQFHKKLTQICEERYLVQFTLKKYQMARISFLVVCLRQSKRLQPHQTMTFINRGLGCLQSDNSRDHIELQIASSNRSSQSKQQEDQQVVIMQHNANSSLTSMTQKQNYPLSKTIEKFITFLQSPESIRDHRLNKFNIIIVLMLLFLSVIDFVSFYGYKKTLLEIEGIFFADGAVSDIMQTTQIAYNQLFALRSQLKDKGTDFNSTLKSLQVLQNYLYSLKQFSFSHLIKDVTELSHQRLYSYIQKPAEWKMENNVVSVQTYQFLQHFYYLTNEVIEELLISKQANLPPTESGKLQMLFSNFPEMQQLNEFYLNDYQSTANYSHDLLSYLSIASLVVYLTVSLLLGLSLNHYFKFRFQQVVNSFSYFSFIPNQYLQKMKDYYAQLQGCVVESEKLKNIDLHEEELFSIDTYDLFHRSEGGRPSLSSKIRFINYENYYKWISIILVLMLANGLNYLATLQIRNFFTPSQVVIAEINDLMRSQNKLLQSYFNLKSAYYLNSSHNFNSSLYDKLTEAMDQSEVKWNAVADKLTTLFNDYDPNYQSNFVHVLVTNVCQLASTDLTDYQNTKCIKELQLNILDGGILIAMNFFQRNVREALEDLRSQIITKTTSVYPGDYFRQINFIELDKMLIYMFKIYQQTQAVSYNSYINAIILITDNYLQITMGMTAFFIIVLLAWLKSIPIQKEALSLLYGHLLLVPFMILKTNNRIVNNLKEAIEYTDS